MGYVGLPLAVAFADAGAEVVCVDSSAEKVAALASGRSYVEDIPSRELARVGERLLPTTKYAELAGCDAIVICVPTPLTPEREPDLTYLMAAGESVGAVLAAGQLVVLESTTYPGSTREELAPLLERSGLRAGDDFGLAFSPERIDPGRTDYDVRSTPKLVGGLTESCTRRAEHLYGLICDEVVPLSSPEAAEMAKLLENVFRSVNIAFVNELAQLCHRLGIDVWEVVGAAAPTPFGFLRFDPGPGMGGHCLPVDPFYLAHKAREVEFEPAFIELAGKVNQAQPAYCVDRVEQTLLERGGAIAGTRVLVLGVSYKGGVGDTRESPALRIIQLLRERGASVSYHDPYVPELPAQGLSSVEISPALGEAEIVVLVTRHPQFELAQLVAESALLLDLRGATRELPSAPNVILL